LPPVSEVLAKIIINRHQIYPAIANLSKVSIVEIVNPTHVSAAPCKELLKKIY